MKNKFNILFVLFLLSFISLACNLSELETDRPNVKNQVATKTKQTGAPVRIDSYSLRGLEFVYYKVSAKMSREQLIETAQQLHEAEPKAQLILVDDDSQVQDYVKYAKAVSEGNYDAELPKQWAEDHIIATAQKLLSGKWMLYESYGYKEIAELK